MPHNGAVITALAVVGLTHKQAYKPIMLAVLTPILPVGCYGGGSLSSMRTDDLSALPFRALIQRDPELNGATRDDVIHGCANQAGKDSRNTSRMAALLAGLSVDVASATVNRRSGRG